MPHPILFLENLPQDATTDDIAAVFKVVCSRLLYDSRAYKLESKYLLLSSLELGDTKVYEPYS